MTNVWGNIAWTNVDSIEPAKIFKIKRGTAWEHSCFDFWLFFFFISVLFSLERNLVGNLRGATSCMEITAKAAGVSDPKDRTGKKKKKTAFWSQDEIHGQTTDLVSMNTIFPIPSPALSPAHQSLKYTGAACRRSTGLRSRPSLLLWVFLATVNFC